jgi:hypothetical protein
MFLGLLAGVTGCGGGVKPGVAEGPDETAPAQTEEVMANEAESARNAASGNQQ